MIELLKNEGLLNAFKVDKERLSCSLAVKLHNFWGIQKKKKKKDQKWSFLPPNALISVKIAILTSHNHTTTVGEFCECLVDIQFPQTCKPTTYKTCNKLPFFKPIKIFKNVNKVSLHVSANRISIKHSPTAVVRYEEWGLHNFHRNQTFGRRIDHLFVYLMDLKNCAIWQLDWIKVFQYQLEYNERGLVTVWSPRYRKGRGNELTENPKGWAFWFCRWKGCFCKKEWSKGGVLDHTPNTEEKKELKGGPIA